MWPDCTAPEPDYWPGNWAWRLACDWPSGEEAAAQQVAAIEPVREQLRTERAAVLEGLGVPSMPPALITGGALVLGGLAVDLLLLRGDGTRLVRDLITGRS